MSQPRDESGRFVDPNTPINQDAVRNAARAAASEAADLGDYGFDPELDLPITRTIRKPSEQPEPDNKPSAAKPTTSRHLPEMVSWARELGISEEDIETLSPGSLASYLRNARNDKGGGANRREADQLPEAGKVAPPPAVKREPVKVDLSEFKDLFDAETVEGIDKIVSKIVAAHLGDLESRYDSRLNEVGDFLQKQKADAKTSRIDSMFNSLNIPELGQGTLQELMKSDPRAAKKRVVVNNMANSLVAANKTELTAAILKSVFEDIYDVEPSKGEPSRKEPARPQRRAPEPELSADDVFEGDDNYYTGGGALRPTSRRSAALPHGDRRAQRTVAEKMRNGDFYAGNEEDGIPD